MALPRNLQGDHPMKIWILTLMVLIGPVTTRADSPRPQDFAFGCQLTVDTFGSLYKITLPETVYQNATQPDLGDLRVFNHQGEAVPYHLLRPQSDHTREPEPVSLPFFPVFQSRDKKDATISLNLRTDAAGAIMVVTGKTDAGATAAVSAYLIDVSQIKKTISALELHWEGADSHFITTVSVSYSQDMTTWRTLVSAATLTGMRYGGHHLEQRRIHLPLRKARYLRLSWPAGVAGVRLKTVRGTVLSRIPSQPRRFFTRSGVRHADHPRIFDFDTQGVFPTDRVNIRLPQINSLIQAVVTSRATADTPWRQRCRGLFYNLRMNQTDLKNPVFSCARTSDRYWRLEILSDTGGLGESAPRLELGWTPDDLIFLARGESPFTLAFGSAQISAPSQSDRSLIEPLQNKTESAEWVRLAQIGRRIELGGASKRIPPPSIPWKPWALWGILIAGVAFLAFMARNLYHQMNRPEKEKAD